MTTLGEIINTYFTGKYLIPTDNIRQQSDRIFNEYVEMMRKNQDVPAIYIATSSPSRIGETVPVKELVGENSPIYVVDGHHRYMAWLANRDYPLMATFVDQEPDKREISDLFDYLDAYEWAKKQ